MEELRNICSDAGSVEGKMGLRVAAVVEDFVDVAHDLEVRRIQRPPIKQADVEDVDGHVAHDDAVLHRLHHLHALGQTDGREILCLAQVDA